MKVVSALGDHRPVKLSEFKRRVIITGGAGFIGSNLLRRLIPKYPDYLFVNLDCLTYAGNLGNLSDLQDSPNYRFEKVSILNRPEIERCFRSYQPDGLIHLAAESHVDRSIESAADFIATNITGTYNLLESAREAAANRPFRFHHISTDEVFGSIMDGKSADEDSSYRPNSPYAASKAASDHLVRAYHVTHHLDTIISHSSNNYGPYQFPEKLIPLFIRNAQAGMPLPVYGDGKHSRDWIYVEDHCQAIDLLFHQAESGSVYNVSSGVESRNIDLVKMLCRILGKRLSRPDIEASISYVTDRPGHDRRYSLSSNRLRERFGWKPEIELEQGLERTVDWYLANSGWLRDCLSGDYLQYYHRMYSNR